MAINTLPFLNQMNKGVANANTNDAMPQLNNNGDPITPEKIEQYRRYKLGQIVSGGNSIRESITFDLSSVSVDKNSKSVSVNIGLVANSFNTHLKNGKTGDALYKAVAKDIAASTGITHMSQYNGSKINEEYLSKLQDFETTDFETLETVIANQVYAQKNEIAKYAKENTLYDLGENPAKSLEEELVYKIVSGTANNDYYGQKIVSLPVAQGNNQNNDERLRIYSTDNGKIVFTKHKENLDRLDKGLSSPIFYYAEFDGKTVGKPQILQSDYLSQNTTIDEKGSVLITGNEELTNGRYKNKTQSLDESSSFLSENGTNLKFDDNKKQQAFTNAYETNGRKTEDRINNYNGSVSNEYQITNVDKTSLNNSLNANVNIKSESVPVPSKSTAKFLSEYYKENGKEFNGKAVVMSPMGEKAPFSSNQIEVNNGVVQSEKSGSTIKEYDDVNSFQNGRNNNNRIASTSAERSLVAHEQGENTSNLGTEYYQEGDPTYYQDARVYTVDVNNPAGGYKRVLRREERDYLIRQLSSGESLQTNDDGVLLELLKQNPNAVSNLGLDKSLVESNGTLNSSFKAAFNSGFSSNKEGINISDLTANNINNIKNDEEVTPLNLTIFDENGDILLTIPESEVLSIIDKLEDNNLSFKDKKGNDQRLSLNTLMEDDIVSNEIITSKKSGEFSGPKIAKQKLYDELSGADNNNSRKIEYAKAVGQYNVNNNKINLQPIKYSSEVDYDGPPKEPILVNKNRAKALLDEAINKNETYRKDLSLATNPKIVSNQGIQPFTPPKPTPSKDKPGGPLPALKPPKETPTTTLTSTPTTQKTASQPTVNKAPSQTIGGDGLLRNAKKDILFDIDRFNYQRYGQDENGDWYAIADDKNLTVEEAKKQGKAIGFNSKEDVETFINEYKRAYFDEYKKGNKYQRLSNDGVNLAVEFSAKKIEKNTTNTTQAAPANTKPLPAVEPKTTTPAAQTTPTATAPAAQPVTKPTNTPATKPQVGLPPITPATTTTQPAITTPATSNIPVTSTQPNVTPPKEVVNPAQANTASTVQPQVGLPAVNNTPPAQQPATPPAANSVNTAVETPNVQPQAGLPQPTGNVNNTPPVTDQPANTAQQNIPKDILADGKVDISSDIDFDVPFYFKMNNELSIGEGKDGNWYVYSQIDVDGELKFDIEKSIAKGEAIKVKSESSAKNVLNGIYSLANSETENLRFSNIKGSQQIFIGSKEGSNSKEVIINNDGTKLIEINRNGYQRFYEFDENNNIETASLYNEYNYNEETGLNEINGKEYEITPPFIEIKYNEDGTIASQIMTTYYDKDDNYFETDISSANINTGTNPFDETGQVKQEILNGNNTPSPEVNQPVAPQVETNTQPTTPAAGLPPLPTPLETKNTTLNQSSPQNALDYITSPESIASLSPDIQANVPPIETSTVQYNPKYTGPLLRPKDRFDQTFTSNDFQNPFTSVSVNDPRSIGTDESGNPILTPQIAGFKKPYIPPLSESGQRILPPHLANLRRPTVPPQELGSRMINNIEAMPLLPGGSVINPLNSIPEKAAMSMLPGGVIANSLNSIQKTATNQTVAADVTTDPTVDPTTDQTTARTGNKSPSPINRSETNFSTGGAVYDAASIINMMRAGANYMQPPPPRVQMERMDPARIRVDRAPFEQASQQITAQGNDMINAIQDNTGSASTILAAAAQAGTNMANAQNQINAQYSQVAQNVMAQNAQMQQQANQFNAQMGSQENQVNAQLQMQQAQMKQQAIDQNINAAVAAQAQKESYLNKKRWVDAQNAISKYQIDMEQYNERLLDPELNAKYSAEMGKIDEEAFKRFGEGTAYYDELNKELDMTYPVDNVEAFADPKQLEGLEGDAYNERVAKLRDDYIAMERTKRIRSQIGTYKSNNYDLEGIKSGIFGEKPFINTDLF